MPKKRVGVPLTIYLYPEHISFLRTIGQNVSETVRTCIEVTNALQDKYPEIESDLLIQTGNKEPSHAE